MMANGKFAADERETVADSGGVQWPDTASVHRLDGPNLQVAWSGDVHSGPKPAALPIGPRML
jgi:hypothetical protein